MKSIFYRRPKPSRLTVHALVLLVCAAIGVGMLAVLIGERL